MEKVDCQRVVEHKSHMEETHSVFLAAPCTKSEVEAKANKPNIHSFWRFAVVIIGEKKANEIPPAIIQRMESNSIIRISSG